MLQAAILSVKLEALEADNARRRAIASAYRNGIENPHLTVWRGDDAGHVYHQFVVRTPQRDALHAFLAERGIGSLVHYPVAVHDQPAYANPGYRPLPLPNTRAWAASVLSLPMFPQLSDADVAHVIEAVNAWPGPA